MTFEEAMKSELEALSGLSGRVFPIIAPQGFGTPYVVYRKETAKLKKVLSGTLNKVEAVYGLFVVADDDADLQSAAESVVQALVGFLFRSIGTGGPLIENITVEWAGDSYVPEIDKFQSKIRIEVKY